MNEIRRELLGVEVPDEHEARGRAWTLVEHAYASREARGGTRISLRPALAAVTAVALLGAALTPPGRAVLDGVRSVVGVEGAEPALFRLPASGRLLIHGDSGAWIVRADGSERYLGRYDEASWSPQGLFVAVAGHRVLAAVDPLGNIRWKLPRRAVSRPRWAPSGFRVAYLSGRSLRVVIGNGEGDRLLVRRVRRVAPIWLPTTRSHHLAYVAADGSLRVLDADTRRRVDARGTEFWISRNDSALVLRQRGSRAPVTLRQAPAVSVAPRSRRVAFVRRTRAGSSEVLVTSGGPDDARRVFSGTGNFTDVEWSPDERWLAIGWKTADQIVFVRVAGRRRIEAAADVSSQFGSGRFPSLAGWCCA